ncbi:helix-turn-helix transcriptional regulator [Hymenobacter sp.]|uniref:helix-turn-helix transcriptional regulator n=1 Tax=Hymenobacter sp. TaxID=1898978 RepID=UPI00286CE020|nr:helix-turn-helix transcriptional regulator [Hymenobacter sp.]
MSELTINERIKFLIEKSGMSVRAFSSAIGVTDTNTRNYIDRGSKPNSEFLEKLIRRFSDTNPTWLLLGEGQPFLPKNPNSVELPSNPIKNNSGNSVGINHGISRQSQGASTAVEVQLKAALELAQQEIGMLRDQLRMKDQVIETKDEMLTLLRSQYNRPN